MVSHDVGSLFISFEDDLLYLHLVEQLVAFQGLAQGYDLVCHESDPESLVTDGYTDLKAAYPSLCWFFLRFSNACGKMDLTGHLPIWSFRFLP